ncbi:unnamed protein product [Schistosoma margrebowiei]|uniref:T-complex-associated testis-expressed protein 1 n=1 Tax=Schistosoma margrebowiei TaxID=48269 RepID=A0A3P7XN71_9TREM|nr:unnamed protein product [Schistosoma margrebowiei]
MDLSWNPQISPNQLNYLLSMNCLKALKCLRLRGCSTFQNISTNKQCPINLPVSTLELSSLNWLNNNSSEVFMKTLEKFNTFKESSFGDQLLNSICSALIKGNIRLQILDMGHCQLTYHCLTSLKSLFGTPGISLTTLIIDHNPMLRNVVVSNNCPFPSWIQILQAIAQPASAVVIPDNDSDALTAAFNSVEAKLLPTISSTPLQELVIIYNEVRINDDWTVENFPNHDKSMKSRFLFMLSNLFTKRFVLFETPTKSLIKSHVMGNLWKRRKRSRYLSSSINEQLGSDANVKARTDKSRTALLQLTPDDTDAVVNQQVINKELVTLPENSKMQSGMPLLNESIGRTSPSQTKEKFGKYTSDHRIMRRIVAEDPNYNLTIVPPLADLCLKHCTENFEYNPIPFMYMNEKQKRRLLDTLPPNLSLKVISHIIDDNDPYWMRCCYAKWPIIDITQYDGSWKRAYFERLLEEIIETFIPGTTYTCRLKECVHYAAPYIQRLIIRQLLPPLKQTNKQTKLDDDSGTESELEQSHIPLQVDHLNLNSILEKLFNLNELSITYTIKDCGMNFEWSLFQFTINDCLNLSKAIQQHTHLKILNLINHVNSEQCRLLATHLQNHPTLECLNLSHNSIGYHGIRALSKLLTGKNHIKSLNLTNNHLKSTSGLALAYSLSQSDCHLVQLNLRMNKLQDDGGIALAKALIQNSTLKELNLAVNDLHENTATYFGHVLTQNSTLTHLDLSNNQIGVVGSKKLQDGMDQNSSLIHLDLRFTGSSQEAEYAISQRIEMNQAMNYKLQQEISDTYQCIPCEITSVARKQRSIVEQLGEVPFTSLRI